MKDSLKIIAAVLCILYIFVQAFQWYVFDTIPETGNATTDFLNGARPLNIYRSVAMLLSMFGFIFIYHTICLQAAQVNKALASLAFIGFFIFCLLEIMLRSVELFYVQISLPVQYAAATAGAGELIVQQVNVFYGVQQALYFPLMFSPWLASAAMVFIFRNAKGINRILPIVFLINFCRVGLRLAAMYLHADLLGDSLTNALYLPLVVIVFGLKAIWLWKTGWPKKNNALQ